MKITREKKYQTWAGWKRAAKEAGATLFEGDKDIAQAFAVIDPSKSAKKHPGDYSNLFAVGEWDGAEGSVYTYETVREMPGMHDDFPTRNPRTSRDTIRVEKKYQTWAGWKRAAKEAGATLLEGDKDIAQAFGVVDPSRSSSDRSNLFAVGEWDGVEGSVYTYKTVREMPGMHDDFPTRNPRSSRDAIRVGDKVIGIMGVDGGYAGVVTDVAWDSRGRMIVTYRDAQSGEERATFAFNLSKNVPARGVFPRKNPLRRLPGESERDFMARCMSAEKKKFPRQDQRVAVCLSKARRNPTGDLEV